MKKPKIAWVKFFPSSIMVCYKYGKGRKRKIKEIKGHNTNFLVWCVDNCKSSQLYVQCFVKVFEFTF